MRTPLPCRSELVERVDWSRVRHQSSEMPAEPWFLRLVDRLLKWLFRDRTPATDGSAVAAKKWAEFADQFREGDEVWSYASGDGEHLAGRSGYALVRNGEVVAAIVILEN